MTSKSESLETSEFLRRRQLRLQQVREQSKDIAKKIRQRAKVEKLRQVVELDERKEKDYKQNQEKVVKKLEELYSRGLSNVGSSHKQARGLTQSENLVEKVDLSRLRGREAAAEVKKQKQQKLDELKKALDRKLQAREAANELSREKSASAANKLSKLSSKIIIVNEETQSTTENVNGDVNLNNKDLPKEVSRADMGTQWDIDLLSPQWEPNVPALALPHDDDIKESAADKDNGTDKQRKSDLFAVSDEMPLSLRGGAAKPCDTGPSKLSSTLVSEYIQNRVLRLREFENNSSKQKSDDLKNLRQTITRSRPLRPEGSAFSNICHVVEGQVFPVPMWHPETSCQCQSLRITHSKQPLERKHFAINVTNSNKIFSSIAPVKPNWVPGPVLRKARPLIPHKCCEYNELAGHANGLLRSKESENVLAKKKSVTTYNHSTRDTRDVPRVDERIVYRDRSLEQDAYSQALSEAMAACSHEKQKKSQDSVNKIAMTRQNVDKEYKDTIAFLNRLPKNKSTRPINNAFKDDHRLQEQRDNRQRILQQEFRNIEKESRRQDSQGCRSKSRLPSRSPSKRSKSPADLKVDNNLNERDFRYSWMPVPESDSKLAVHTIPADGRAGRATHPHSVKFGVDSYHEYRSRHKHTPPTKDTAGVPATADRNTVRTVMFQNDDDSLSDESVASDNSSTEGREPDPKRNVNIDDSLKRRELTDTERIIIYKILDCKHRKKNKSTKVNNSDDVAGGNGESKDTQDITEPFCKEAAVCEDVERDEHVREDKNLLGADHITEGVYEVVGKNKDNLESMYYSGLDNNQSGSDNKCDKRKKASCSRRTDAGDGLHHSRKKCSSAKCKGHSPKSQPTVESSQSGPAAPGAAATAASAEEARFVKLMDDEQKKGNFYIGATGFLKNDAYEVIIQLRKNDTTKEVAKTQDVPIEPITAGTRNENTNITKLEVSSSFGAPSLYHKDDVQQKELSNDMNYLAATAPHPPVTEQDFGVNGTEDNEKQCLSEAMTDDVQPIKRTLDKSVSTSFNESIPESIAKSEPIARPATSTCTQTTPSPSNPRPVYIHMSSSTSTAYMSPPEVVLPNFFKQGDKPCRKARRTAGNIKKQEKINVMRHEHRCKSYSSCKIFEKMLTKPKIDRLHFCADMYSNKNEYPPFSYESNKCSEHNTRGASELCCKHHTCKIKHHLTASKQTISMCNTKNAVKRNRTGKYASKVSSKSYLSPMIKQYIHKLLSLNREGIKAIQIMNQDCSSVNTPASSIINVPTNFSTNNCQRRHLVLDNRDWEEFGSVLRQRVFLHNNATHAMFTRPNNGTKGRNRKANNIKPPRNAKNKRVHKIKSLNISKKIIVKTSEESTKTKVDNCAKTLLSNVASGEQDSPPSDHIENYRNLSGNKNILETRTTSTEISKRKVNNYGRDVFSAEQLKAASSNSNSNDEIPSKPLNISTQTSCTVDSEINFIKLAEGKLQNMEKIADLTEKCTKRLSNLAKVLEEVRKNKSLAYSQVSTADSTSESDQKSDNMVSAENIELKIPLNIRDDFAKNSKNQYNIDSTDYESLISGVPNSGNIEFPQDKNSDLYETSNSECISQSASSVSTNGDYRENNNTKCRNRPPPALLRMNLKRPQDHVVPHELSTVMEVDSPLSVKFKQQSPINTNQSTNNLADPNKDEESTVERQLHPELVLNIVNKSSNEKNKVISDSPEDSKLQMMDLNQFNEIMLKPFISLQEYARDHYEISTHTKRDNFSNDVGIPDDISSLHSDGSLPDVVAELLKRKLITEPFRFDTASNMNSTTLSSESTLSVLALSKVRKDKSKSRLTANKENVGETSDSLSISSNPDLENAFKKLGMGWASSTLKKTKERLALSSSSNTSSASFSQVKFKNSRKLHEPATDAVWSVSNISKKPALKRRLDTSKNAEQQTSFTNNMTVKEFLTKELAKKITFTDKSNRNDTNQEFVSLFETKLPEDFKNSSQTMLDDNSGNSVPSGNNNRARTSTPVKLFKSVTYHSSSSSNMSNGLFSNADELSSVKLTSASARHQSASDKDELTIPNCSLKMRKTLSDCSKTDSC
ncbi:uncharacterized protein LOC133519379 isoform X2 [Cydia pomonella]|uniref:uncharacterized protein LOC133519379 isoform X2 n=1 Tax=Cydia pomonella TaxID=82600 RepID=UPI002ADE0B90|nr:uncharacterized protein LOC133519379 isoform X2 [Cydia pomonella]